MNRALPTLVLAMGVGLPALAANPAPQPQAAALHQASARPRVTAIFLSVTMPDGTVQNLSVDPAKTEAIFFTDRGVTEMLGRFYDRVGTKTLPTARLHGRFGAQTATTLLGGQSTYPLSAESLTTLWNTPNTSGSLPAVMLKSPDCEPTEWP